MKRLSSLLTATFLTFLLTGPSLAKPFEVDGAHSSVHFTVTHLQLSEVEGRFNDFKGTVDWNQDKPAASKIQFTVDVDSVDTGNAKRDEHLQSADFFDAEKFKTMSFKSTSVSKLSGTKYKLVGDLTIHGVTKSITTSADIKGPVDPFGDGNMSLGFKTDFKINRIDYGVGSGWKGGSDKIVGHEVFISIKGEAHEPK